MASFKWDKTGLFAAGVLFGTAGIKLLSSKDAKKVYTECTAAVLRAKDCVMKTVTTVQENVTSMQMHSRSTRTERQQRSHSRMRLPRARLSSRRLKTRHRQQRKLLSNLSIKQMHTGDCRIFTTVLLL